MARSFLRRTSQPFIITLSRTTRRPTARADIASPVADRGVVATPFPQECHVVALASRPDALIVPPLMLDIRRRRTAIKPRDSACSIWHLSFAPQRLHLEHFGPPGNGLKGTKISIRRLIRSNVRRCAASSHHGRKDVGVRSSVPRFLHPVAPRVGYDFDGSTRSLIIT